VPPVLDFIRQKAGIDDREAYGTLNMGAGFALFVAPDDAQRTIDVARGCGIDGQVAGTVERGDKQVVIEPLGLTFAARELHVRA
jgi:phosphoribosylformylglycinamidine cyclo-ligase